MSAIPVYPRVISDDMVEDAVRATLRKWTSTWLRIVEEQAGLQAFHYERPRTWEIHSGFDKYPEEAMPAIIVMNVGTDDLNRDGRSQFRETYGISVATFASSVDMDKSRQYCFRLSAAVRIALVARQSLDGAFDGSVRKVVPLGSRNGEMPLDADRTIWAKRQVFAVEVANVMTEHSGPSQPDDEPPPDTDPLPEVPIIPDRAHIHTTFEKV